MGKKVTIVRGKNWVISNVGKKNRALFFAEMEREFPTIRTLLDEEEDDMIYFKMEHFADYTLEQIEKKNILELKRCYDFIEKRIHAFDLDLLSALNISYLEALLLCKASIDREFLKQSMPKNLKRKFMIYQHDYEKLANHKIAPNK